VLEHLLRLAGLEIEQVDVVVVWSQEISWRYGMSDVPIACVGSSPRFTVGRSCVASWTKLLVGEWTTAR
jgi:hypothetical protein